MLEYEYGRLTVLLSLQIWFLPTTPRLTHPNGALLPPISPARIATYLRTSRTSQSSRTSICAAVGLVQPVSTPPSTDAQGLVRT
jgi:hypothetical protein